MNWVGNGKILEVGAFRAGAVSEEWQEEAQSDESMVSFQDNC